MNSHLFSSSPFLSLVCFIWVIFVRIQSSSSNPYNTYESCNLQFQCGNIKAGYPFWGESPPGLPRWEDCGHHDLKLNCEHNGEGDVPTTTMVINGVKYRVLDIISKDQTLKIARMDYFEPEGICSRAFLNTTINSELFDYSDGTYENVTFLFDCSPSPETLPLQVLPCKNITGAAGHKNWSMKARDDDHGSMCDYSVFFDFFPVPKNSLNWKEINDDHSFWRQVLELDQGLELKWKLRGILCEECTNSSGICGWDRGSKETICFCPNQPNHDSTNACRPATCSSTGLPSDCNDSNRLPDQAPIGSPDSKGNGKLTHGALGGIVAGSAVAGIVVIVLLLLIIRKRRKIAAQTKTRDLQNNGITSTTTTSLSQSIPSYPSSKLDLERGMTSTYFGAHVFSYDELEQATNNFHPSKELGDGGFGTVYYGELKDGRSVAVKRLYERSLKRVEQFMTEIEILTKLRHPNLVTLYGCTSRHSRELLLVYEYIPNGTVADHLHGRNSNSVLLPWPVRLSIAVETAYALAFLHTSDVIHRDVKTNNILLENDFRVKVADFGLSRLFPTDVTHVSTAPQGTPGYVDPEYYHCYKLTDKSDVFSFGVVLIELISSLEAVDTNRHRHDINLANMAVNKIQNQALSELVDESLGFERDYAVRSMVTSVAELAFRCLQQDREIRPSMQEVVDVLKRIQDEHFRTQKPEVADIITDDAALLKNAPPPISPNSASF